MDRQRLRSQWVLLPGTLVALLEGLGWAASVGLELGQSADCDDGGDPLLSSNPVPESF